MSDSTYNVRVLKIERRLNADGVVTSYRLGWMVDGRRRKKGFRTAALADAYRAELLSATRRGEAFGLDSGVPLSWTRRRTAMAWYEFATAYAAVKWPLASANHRRGIAEALVDATEALLTGSGGPGRE